MARRHFQRVAKLLAVFLLLPQMTEPSAMETDAAEAVVQTQLEAYNAHDVQAFVATYASDAEIYEFPAKLLMKGAAQIEDYYATKRFNDPRLHATLAKRMVMGDVVVDHEKIVLTFPEGAGRLEAIAIYEVQAGKISKVTLLRGKKVIDPIQK
jgi:uncharacterized protein (TIGR02246 family)